MQRYTLLILTLIVEGAVLILALILSRFLEIQLLPISQNYSRDILYGTVGAIFPLFLFILSLSNITEGISFLDSLRNIMIKEIKGIFSNSTLSDLILISILAGISEEFLFRGVIQTRLGIIPASVIFGLLHFITPVYAIIATVMGLYLGVLFNIFGSLLIPVQLHLIYDLGALIYLKYYTQPNTK